jgi:hemoglobin
MAGIRRLADAWRARVMAGEVVSHAFSHGFHPQHTDRLAAYWAEALGGPASYSDAYGNETSVGVDADPRLRQALHDYFAWVTTVSMAQSHESADDVPVGMRIPRWSWDGLVE